MERMIRTFSCGDLRAADEGKTVILNGWVHRNRNHGEIHFINLRDRYGITQLVMDTSTDESLRDTANSLKYEYCIAAKGTVRRRPDDMINPDMATGEVEVLVNSIEILGESEVLPFMIDGETQPGEDLRLTYRYLDLRTERMQNNIKLRHDVSFRVREYLHQKDFLEIETPSMIKSTPEGSRDFLVPSRLNPGTFYALPQSPQLYKQMLMVSGFDKYFQIAHCFRDEDLRGDRQPEHTQIDIEMSFVSQDDIFTLIEGMMSHVFKHTLNVDLKTPFPRISYDEAMNSYGSDKPDLRFDLKMQDLSDTVKNSGFQVFSNTVKDGGVVKALRVPQASDYSRKMITELEDQAKIFGAKGLAWTKVSDSGQLEGGIGKFLADQSQSIIDSLAAEPGDLLLFMADQWLTACTALGAVRSKLGKGKNLIPEGEFNFSWIVEFPMFEWNEDENRWEASHHMFTMPEEKYLDNLEKDPGSVKGQLYDLVCNGNELASGSIRIHDSKIQERIFDIVGFDKAEAEKRFGFLLKAFKFGAPPHGGIAPGLDRLVMVMSGEPTIREVMAFPKNTAGASLVDESPSTVDEKQLEELNLAIVKKKESKSEEE